MASNAGVRGVPSSAYGSSLEDIRIVILIVSVRTGIIMIARLGSDPDEQKHVVLSPSFEKVTRSECQDDTWS